MHIYRDQPMSDKRREELKETLQQMQKLSDDFYLRTIQLYCHPFIEFTGFLNQYIQMCRRTLESGVDFTELNGHSGRGLAMDEIDADYIFEKFNCIFGPSMQKVPNIVDIFTKSLHLTSNDDH